MPCHTIYPYCSTPHRTELYYTALSIPRCRCAIPHCPPPPPLHHSSFIIHPSIHHLVSVITYQSSILVITRFCSSPRLSEHPNTEHRPTPPHLPSLSPLPTPHWLGLSPRLLFPFPSVNSRLWILFISTESLLVYFLLFDPLFIFASFFCFLRLLPREHLLPCSLYSIYFIFS